ncbi:MAG: hypothetical protein CDV28_102119 [Candidatus Electronema aureum]|uniref:Uncharacterized protein n=1 Tax=Candidatus Electronema aureum TaxID=2005002 RepID=A0A521G4P4_9BACT|nr:MAG: hypothetical protein CDV28_102119 [Candidatus Electronema aureum]
MNSILRENSYKAWQVIKYLPPVPLLLRLQHRLGNIDIVLFFIFLHIALSCARAKIARSRCSVCGRTCNCRLNMIFLLSGGGLLLRHLLFQLVVVFLIAINLWMAAGKFFPHNG